MLLLTCREIKKSFADHEVLQGVNLEVYEGERLGLVGTNGAGKTTLVKIIMGQMAADTGYVQKYRDGVKFGYLQQNIKYSLQQFTDFFMQEEDQTQLQAFYQKAHHLGLDELQEWGEERFQGLSGGEKTKLALAEVWATNPDFLILDEPTNHLDFLGVDWLINELESFSGTILIISHDRYFLDQTVSRIVELEQGQAKSYPGNYTAYRREKQRLYEQQLHQYMVQKKTEAKIEREINQLKNWSAKAHREAGKVGKMVDMRKGIKEFYRSKAKKMDKAVKSKIKRLEKMREEGVERPSDEPQVQFVLNDADRHGKRIVEATGLTKKFAEKHLFADSSFCIQRGEKVGLLGPNGCGKTTLLRILLNEIEPDEGLLWLSPSAKVGYISQEMSELDPQATVLEVLGMTGRFYTDSVRNLLAGMGFDQFLLEKPVKALSMGEKTRLKLATLIQDQADVLLLDEPTNHLDLYNREELEHTLSSFQGTMFLVSHDRYMLEKLCDRFLIFDQGKIRKWLGTFADYQKRTDAKNNDNLRELESQLMVMENRLTVLLSSFNRLSTEDPEYQKLNDEFQAQIRQKKLLQEQIKELTT